MSLATIMLDQLTVARRIIADGQEVVPAWRISSPEGDFLIFTRFDTAIGVSHHERLAVLQRTKRGDDVSFSEPMWLARHHVDDRYFAMLARGETEITAEEAAVLARVFGKHGELPAERLG